MSLWTPDRVLALAPDSASVSAGRDLSSPAKWASAGVLDHALWGEAKGSGAKPYQTAVDLREPAFKCSCPSRKFPCKHALGLMLRFAKGEIPSGDPPGWAAEWLEKRDSKTVKTPARESEPDPEAAAKRAEKRWDTILTGLDECEAFLLDAASQGLLASHSARTWDQMAARMVDAQAPGAARRLRKIGSAIGVGRDWAQAAGGEMGGLILLAEAARRCATLPDPLQADIRTTLGIPLRKEEIKGEKVKDSWDLVGQVQEEEDKIRVLRSWLRGRSTGRWGLHLAFSAGKRPFDVTIAAGTAFEAEAEFYPSSWPLRVHLEERQQIPFQPLRGEAWEEALDEASRALAAQPWLEQFPVLLAGARFSLTGEEWWAVDEKGAACRISGPPPWQLLSLSGGEPMALMGEWSGGSLRPLAGWGSWGFGEP